jgi:hypothetical protein
MSKSQQMKDILTAAGANIRSLSVIGAWVHIDTFAKYENLLRSTMAAAGFQCVKISDGIHMDGTEGYRIVFKVQG